MRKIPSVDLVRQYEQIQHEANKAVLEVLSSGRYINGPVVAQFEQEFSDYLGLSHTVCCASGTDALYLALRALKIESGDEIITSPFTFIATAEVISLTGATPVFIDIQAETFNLNPQLLEAAITPKTKAIIPVHLYGQAVNMDKVMEIANRHNLYVIEDCAQATGATWQGRKVGSFGDVGCFSFFPTKNLGGCGDGGAITTDNLTLAQTMIMLKEHGSNKRYCHEETGVNSRLDAIQAAILRIKLTHLDKCNQERYKIAQLYNKLLSNITEIILPEDYSQGGHVWNQYTIRVKGNAREELKEQLEIKGITSMVYYPIPLHLQPVYQKLGYKRGSLPVVEQTCLEVLSLPMFPGLQPEEQEAIVYALKESFQCSQKIAKSC